MCTIVELIFFAYYFSCGIESGSALYRYAIHNRLTKPVVKTRRGTPSAPRRQIAKSMALAPSFIPSHLDKNQAP